MVDVRFKPARLFPLQAISQFYPNGVVQDKRKGKTTTDFGGTTYF